MIEATERSADYSAPSQFLDLLSQSDTLASLNHELAHMMVWNADDPIYLDFCRLASNKCAELGLILRELREWKSDCKPN